MKRSRRGLSYLEVLIAAGIALTGLMGVIALYPVASLNMQKGQVADAAAYIGPSVLEGAPSLGAATRSRWIYNNGTAWNAYVGTPGYPTTNTDLRTVMGPWTSFCIDPRLCAENTDAGGQSPAGFPYVAANYTNDEVRMQRITLSNGASAAMGVAQSRLLFKVSDDLLFNKPDDLTTPAAQNYLVNDSSATQRRDYFANFEYMITLTPGLTGVPVYQVPTMAGMRYYPHWMAAPHYEPGLGEEQTPYQSTNQYTMSVVVMHQRQPRLETILAAGPNSPAAERVVSVAAFGAGGIAGGDVQIETRTGQPESDIFVREGEWVLLSGMTYSKPATNNGPRKLMGPLFQWYKVVGLEAETEPSGSTFKRWVTLEGPDWPVDLVPNGTQMTIVSGAVAVYQQTVTIR